MTTAVPTNPPATELPLKALLIIKLKIDGTNAIFENTINKPAERYTITINGTILEATSAIRCRPPNITIETINAIIIPIVKSNGIVEAILGFVLIN